MIRVIKNSVHSPMSKKEVQGVIEVLLCGFVTVIDMRI